MLVLVASAGLPAWADEAEDAAHAASAVGPRAGPLRPARLAVAPWPVSTAARPGAIGWGIGVVELPANSALPGPRRPHHALSIASESPRRLLRSIGIEATECSTRIRLPTKLKQLGSGVRAEMQGQLLVACRF